MTTDLPLAMVPWQRAFYVHAKYHINFKACSIGLMRSQILCVLVHSSICFPSSTKTITVCPVGHPLGTQISPCAPKNCALRLVHSSQTLELFRWRTLPHPRRHYCPRSQRIVEQTTYFTYTRIEHYLAYGQPIEHIITNQHLKSHTTVKNSYFIIIK